MRLSGKVAVVTGSAVGLGRAVASRYAREGAAVVVADTNAPDGAAVVEQIRKDGGRGIFVRTDVGEERDVTTLLQSAWAQFGRIDVLYNNAAVLFHDRDARAHELSLELWEQVMRVNLQGTFLCSKHVIPFMLKQGGGSIINLGSPYRNDWLRAQSNRLQHQQSRDLWAHPGDGGRVRPRWNSGKYFDPGHDGYADECSSAGRRGNPGAIPGSGADGAPGQALRYRRHRCLSGV